MSDERQAMRIYQVALELDGEERCAYVEREAAGDEGLKNRVHGLLQSAQRAQAQGFLDQPASENIKALGTNSTRSGRPLNALPEIDRYRLIETLGEGGFGTVYLAEQLEPVRREVALKLIRSDRLDQSFARRFNAERQMLALLNHPGIAQIFDAGATAQGDPYLVMERIDGEPITDYCDNHRLDLIGRIELFVKVCAALQHAHQKGIIHRDIKPANVLVTEQDGNPVPKVIDFGIARAADLRVNENTLQTEGGVLGSPMYMSPEQVDPREDQDIDTRADVYSLGVLLYELLVGATPFEVARGSLLQALRKILETDPPRPSVRAASVEPAVAAQRRVSVHALVRQLKNDLDWILLKALEKDRERRYESAAAMAADLQRVLADQPVEARPPSVRYRMSKFLTRHKLGVAASALLVLSMLAGLIGTSVGFLRAREEAQRVRETLGLLQEFLSAPAPELQGKDLTVVKLLESFEPRVDALSDRPAIQAELLHSYAATYFGLGLFDRAAEFAERAAALQTGLGGDTHPQSLAAIHLLGSIRMEQGQYAEAVALQRSAYDRAHATLGEGDLTTIDYAVGLAEALKKSGERGEAATLHRDALNRRRVLLGDNHDDTLHSMNKLGETLFTLDQRAEALALAREAAERRSEHFGPDHPETLHAMSNLSYQLGETGRYDQAAAMDREILDRRIRVLGEEHRKTVVSMINLAWVLDKLARYDESIALNRRALAILERTVGSDSPDTLTTKANLALALLKQGDAATAEGMMREVIEARSRVLGPEHPMTLVGIGDLARVLEQQQRFDEAIPMVRHLIRRRIEVHGPDHHNTLVARSQLSGLLSHIGEFDEAETWAREALAARIDLSGAKSTHTLSVKLNLARATAGQGKLDTAQAFAREVLDASTRDLGADHPSALAALEALADIRARQGELGDAEALFRKALEQRSSRQGAEHPQTLRTRERLAELTMAAAQSEG